MLTDEMQETVHLVKVELSKEFDQAEEPTEEWACVFAERLLAALPKSEPVGEIGFYGFQWTQHGFNTDTPIGTLFYTAPQDTAAIEQRVAEACANLSESSNSRSGEHDGTAIGHAIRSGKWREFL